MNRLANIAQGLGIQNITNKNPNDVVICCALRTPITKYKKGLLKDTAPQILLSTVFKQIISRTGIDPKLVEDVAVGNNYQPGAGEVTARMAVFLAGFPQTTTTLSLNRFCSSGLQSCAVIASKITAGMIDIGIGAGVESMSIFPREGRFKKQVLSKEVFDHPKASLVLMPMGITSENVAEKFNITREMQDQFSLESHQKASLAQKKGLFDSEIVTVKTKVKDDQGNEREVNVTKDDGIRENTTIEGLAKLKPAFKKGGTTTAGNSSQMSDGAAAVLFARRSLAQKLNLPILGRFAGYVTKGCPPEIMGIGPTVAVPQLLKKAGRSIQEVDILELNEAFASQAVYCIQNLRIKKEKVNPKGGAIALGHPLGCTGSRQIATILPQLQRTKGRWGVVSMCIGSGMGAAALIERQ